MRYTRFVGVGLVLCGSVLAGGCDRGAGEAFPTVDRVTAGIFLDPEERAALPAGMALRPVYTPGIELTKLSEGFRSHLYNDAARFCTIAYGHLVKRAACDGTEPVEFLRGLSEPRGTQLLVGDMERAQVAVLTAVEVDLTDGQYAALCDFVYNVGSGNFRQSTLRRVVNEGRQGEVPFQFRRWVKAGGRELPGLKRRRDQEIDLFFEGIGVPRAAPPEGIDLTPIDIRLGEAAP